MGVLARAAEAWQACKQASSRAARIETHPGVEALEGVSEEAREEGRDAAEDGVQLLRQQQRAQHLRTISAEVDGITGSRATIVLVPQTSSPSCCTTCEVKWWC